MLFYLEIKSSFPPVILLAHLFLRRRIPLARAFAWNVHCVCVDVKRNFYARQGMSMSILSTHDIEEMAITHA